MQMQPGLLTDDMFAVTLSCHKTSRRDWNKNDIVVGQSYVLKLRTPR